MGRSGNRPQPRRGAQLRAVASASSAGDTGTDTPYFCLNCQQPGYMVTDLDDAGRLAFLEALHKRRGMTWNELLRAPKHGLGSEWMPVAGLRARLPAGFADRERVMVFRYRDRLPMVGVRVDRVFHVLFIERHYGELYEHGGS